MNDTAVFRIEPGVTKQYYCQQNADDRDEEKAKAQLIDKAKAEGMVEWCFLAESGGYDISQNKKIVAFNMMANPFKS